MQSSDWSRTSITERERGGALVSAYDDDKPLLKVSGQVGTRHVASAETLWKTLKAFLKRVIPECEEAGVQLSLHPDDPPMPLLRGMPQITYNSTNLKKVCDLVPSPSNGVCFCQGTFASGGEDIPKAIKLLAKHINFIHFRDVKGTVPKFQETWQDSGKTDMVAAVRAYKACGVSDVPMRPDHVPTLSGEDNHLAGIE